MAGGMAKKLVKWLFHRRSECSMSWLMADAIVGLAPTMHGFAHTDGFNHGSQWVDKAGDS